MMMETDLMRAVGIASLLLLSIPSWGSAGSAGSAGGGSGAAADEYIASVEDYRKQREDKLKADDGWLTVVGLFWLEEGANTIGSDPSSGIALPAGAAPGRVGTIDYREGTATITAAPGSGLTCRGEAVTTLRMRSDVEDETDLFEVNDVNFYVIERAGRHGIRVKDKNSSYRRSFTHLEWYPIEPSMRVEARWVPHDPPRKLRVPTILGDVEEAEAPGRAVWSQDGQEVSLTPIVAGERLWFIFKDATSGAETYGAGRYLYSDKPDNGVIVVDFNKAYNMPCVFTPYATCTLPPEDNRLGVPIRAGELNYGKH